MPPIYEILQRLSTGLMFVALGLLISSVAGYVDSSIPLAVAMLSLLVGVASSEWPRAGDGPE